ncbi:caspase-7 [Aplysia californica]|uniref:Caspase-7 n=1 Tax=Aplysia californica TaxID=6500 RepID=A0ABM1AAK9_APLCA|nr:caspase-7 [Aplysia californica]
MAANMEELVSGTQALTVKDESDLDLDSVEGFRKSLKKKISQFACGLGNKEDDENRYSVRSSQSSSSSSSRDFAENRTAFVTAELKTPAVPVDPKADVYDFTCEKRGLAVIINNEDFSQCQDFDDRPGSTYDESSLYHSFQRLGFNVLLHRDLPGWKMVEVLKAAASSYDHRNADCFACAILSHGDQTWTEREWDRLGTKTRLDLLFGVDGRAVATKFIVELFSDNYCPGLEGKPRLFFLQACRGSKLDHGQELPVIRPRYTPGIRPRVREMGDGPDRASGGIDLPDISEINSPTSSSVDPPEFQRKLVDYTDASSDGDAGPSEDSGQLGNTAERTVADDVDAGWGFTREVPVSPTPLYKDCLVMYATPPGYFAWRRSTGAWFVQSLCTVLNSGMVHRMSLVNLLSRVCGLVAHNFQSQNPSRPSMHEKKAVPVVESMLVKDVIFTRKQ